MLKLFSVFSATVLFFGPSSLDRTKHLFIHTPIEIEIEQSSPAFIALKQLSQLLEKNIEIKAPEFVQQLPLPLLSGFESTLPQEPPSFANRRTLPLESDSQIDLSTLSYQQKARLEMAQETYGTLNEDWQAPTLASALEEALSRIPDELKQIEKAQTYLGPQQIKIKGPIEIQGGLAVTDVTRLEVKRHKEGVGFETGEVNLRDGVYEIVVNSLDGSLRAKLVDGSGQILGEDSIRLAGLKLNSQVIAGPPLKLKPSLSYGGRIYGKDSGGSTSPSVGGFSVSALDGNSKGQIQEDGSVLFKEIAKNSQTIASVTEGRFEQIQLAGGESLEVEYLSEKTLTLMLDFINDQRMSERKTFASDGRIIYGKVKSIPLTTAKGQVVLEQYPDLKPIYFNDFFLPDVQQKNLSKNGYFLFVDVPVGFQSIVHSVEGKLYGFANTLVVPHSISTVAIQSDLPKVEAPVRYYDAFTGFQLRGEIELQGQSESLKVQTGNETVALRDFGTYAIAHAYPIHSDYSITTHTYSDQDEYLHFPTISKAWLNETMQKLGLSSGGDHTTSVVGFVPFANFRVYLIDEEQGEEKLAYFDYKGELLVDSEGKAGGGFIISNLPKGVVEIVVEFEESEKLHTRVIPVNPGSVSILQFK